MTKQQREGYWRDLLARQAASGTSVRAWCAQEAIDAALMYWPRCLMQPAQAVPLTLIRVEEAAVSDGLWLSVGNVRIEVKSGFSRR